MTHRLKVFMHADLVDELDESLSPMDGLVAIEQIFSELPRRHAANGRPRSIRRDARRIPIFRGRYQWVDIGFSYVQIGDSLHVIELWHDADSRTPNRPDVDVVLQDMPDEAAFTHSPINPN